MGLSFVKGDLDLVTDVSEWFPARWEIVFGYYFRCWDFLRSHMNDSLMFRFEYAEEFVECFLTIDPMEYFSDS